MLLAYNATSATIAANLGKWRPNAANPTGLYVPKLSDQFFRGWTQGTEDNAGGWQNDTVREIWAKLCDFYGGINMSTDGALPAASVLSMTGYAHREDLVMRRTGDGYFRASNIVPTGPVTAPPHIWQPVIMYLGLPA